MRPAVFLDRDGTIIIDKHYLNRADEVEYFPGVFSALQKLSDAGFLLIVVTNQSGLSRGLVSLKEMDEIHRRIQNDAARSGVEIRKFYYAPFLDGSGREERKPGPKMLELAARDFNIDLSRSWMIGDHLRDVEAGIRAGCRSILLSSNEQDLSALEKYQNKAIARINLIEAAEAILRHPF